MLDFTECSAICRTLKFAKSHKSTHPNLENPPFLLFTVSYAEKQLISIFFFTSSTKYRCRVQSLYLSHVFLLQVEVHGSNSESPPPDSHSSHLSLEPESPPYSRSVSRRKSTLLQVSEPILLQIRKCNNSSSESTRYSKSESTPYTPSQRYTIYCNPESTHCPLSENLHPAPGQRVYSSWSKSIISEGQKVHLTRPQFTQIQVRELKPFSRSEFTLLQVKGSAMLQDKGSILYQDKESTLLRSKSPTYSRSGNEAPCYRDHVTRFFL